MTAAEMKNGPHRVRFALSPRHRDCDAVTAGQVIRRLDDPKIGRARDAAGFQ
jgi:hypothetical protein